jgi:hypothetical protein
MNSIRLESATRLELGVNALALLGFAAATSAVFTAIKSVLYVPQPSMLALFLQGAVALVVCSGLSFVLKEPPASAAYYQWSRGLTLVIGLYATLQYPWFPMGDSEKIWVWAAYVAMVVAAVVSWYRPVFLLAVGYYLWWLRQVAEKITTLPFTSNLDIIVLYDVSALFVASLLVWSLVRVAMRGRLGRLSQEVSAFFTKYEPIRTGDVIPLLCFVLIVANYYYSSMAKITLDGGVFSWISQNNIAHIYSVARDNQQLLWTELPYLADWTYHILNSGKLPLALIMIMFQLFAVFSFVNRKWFIATFIFLDLSHLGIFLLVGANFASWFALNLVLIATARKLPENTFTFKNFICFGLLILLIPRVAFVARLGWYDTLANNKTFFEAIDGDGKRTRVPTTFFGLYSYPLGHMSFGHPPGRYVTTRTNGGTYRAEDRKRAMECIYAEDEMRSPFANRWRPDALARFIRENHHQAVLSRSDVIQLPERWYPHHFWSAPSIAHAFDAIDLRKIVAYELVVESVCLNPENPTNPRKVIARNEFRIAL